MNVRDLKSLLTDVPDDFEVAVWNYEANATEEVLSVGEEFGKFVIR